MGLKEFRVHRLLGKGGYGSVYQATRLSDGLEYALKVINMSKMSFQERQKALNEIRFLASVKHPCVISYYEAFIEGGRLFIVMEFAACGDLHGRIKKRKSARPMKRYTEDLIWSALIQISLGINALHSLNIVHRDIKSSNIFITKDNDLKIGDLGVSKLMESDLTQTMIGTPYYQSPEIWVQTPYSKKIDIWSLGCVIYEMASYQYPFNAQDYKSLGRKVLHGTFNPIPSCYSKDLSDLIDSLLIAVPSKRPSIDDILNMPSVLRRMHLIPAYKRPTETVMKMEESIRVPRILEDTKDIFPRRPYPGEALDEYAADFDSDSDGNEENKITMFNMEGDINVLEEESRADPQSRQADYHAPAKPLSPVAERDDPHQPRRELDRKAPGYALVPGKASIQIENPVNALPSLRMGQQRRVEKDSLDGKPIMPGMNAALRMGIAAAANSAGGASSHASVRKAESSPSQYARKIVRDFRDADEESGRRKYPTDPEKQEHKLPILPVVPVRVSAASKRGPPLPGNRLRLHNALAPHKNYK